jgi:aryl-alcohol dehydrogenase-like predicted oxidoreductase
MFEALQAEGLIRAHGLSSIRPNVIREWVKRSRLASVMTQYSLLDRRPEEETLDLLHERGVGVIARGPVAQGRLSGAGGKRAEKGFWEHTPEEVRRVGSSSLKRTPSLQPSSSPRRSGGACRARLEP